MKKRRFEFEYRPPAGLAADLAAPLAAVPLAEPPEAAAGMEGGTEKLKRQRPRMNLKDEIVLLLHTAAEIEHCLMVQYLYAAYSLPGASSPHAEWREILLQIAREEMGHLMAVQNMLMALGGPLNFEREDFPFNAFYPFPFKLEPFSIASVAKYVLAEMPHADEIPVSVGFDLDEVRAAAGASDGSINRVGALFDLLSSLCSTLSAEAIHSDSLPLQANPEDWQASSWDLILQQVASLTGAMDGLVTLIDAVGAQGEGPRETPEGERSHFLRFFDLYRDAKAHASQHGEGALALSVPTDPTVFDESSPGYLQHPVANAWGDIHNHRFRWLLVCLQHHLLAASDSPGRDRLNIWAFEEMVFLREVGSILTELPQHDPVQPDPQGNPLVAAPTFELPYTLSLPGRPIDRWRHHEILALHSLDQLERVEGSPQLVGELKANDEDRLTFIRQMQEAPQ